MGLAFVLPELTNSFIRHSFFLGIMENISRKSFFKKACFTGACLCGFGSIGLANSSVDSSETDNESHDKKNDLSQEWLSILLSNISTRLDEGEKRKILKNCSSAHYDDLGMNKILAPYKNDIDKFIQFLESQWNWKVDYNKTTKTIIADENKNYCVCPIISNSQKADLSSMCYCSEGFAELMFSYVTGESASATVISSIHKGDDRCIYRIVF
jgi:hypothetical protein